MMTPNAYFLRLYALMIVLLIVDVSLVGQCPDLPANLFCQGDPNESFATYGVATYDCDLNILTLSEEIDVDTFGGAIFFDSTETSNIILDLAKGFSFTIRINFGDHDEGGEGMVLVMAKDTSDIRPCGTGGYLGYHYIPNSIGIEFDTRQQAFPPFNDTLAADHLSLLKNSIDQPIVASRSLLHPDPDVHPTDNVEDGQFHQFIVRWDPEEQLLEVLEDVDNKLYLRLSYQEDLIAFFGQTVIYPGIVGSTGEFPSNQRLQGVDDSFDDPRLVEDCAGVRKLTNWIVTNNPDSSRWNVQNEFPVTAFFAEQLMNGKPSFLVSPISFIDAELEGTIYVKPGGGNGYIGVGFGLQAPFAQEIDNYNGWLLDWRRTTENACNGAYRSPRGITLAYMDGPLTYTTCEDMSRAQLYTHENTPTFNVRRMEDIPWREAQDYRFRIRYMTTSVEAWIFTLDTVNQITDTVYHDFFEGLDNKPGRFGFYNASQAQVRYSDFSYRWCPEFIMSADTICQGEPITFSYALPNTQLPSIVDSMYWDFGDGQFQPATVEGNIPAITHTFQRFGRIPVKLWVIDPSGCEQFHVDTITVRPLPIVDLGPDTLLCPGELAFFAPSYPFAKITWQDSIEQPTWVADEPGTIHVQVDLLGCLAQDMIQVNFSDSIRYELNQGESICAGERSGEIHITEVNGMSPLMISLDGQEGTEFNSLVAGDHLLRILDGNNCILEDTISLNQGCEPDYILEIDGVSCYGGADGSLVLKESGCPLQVSYNDSLIPSGKRLDGLVSGNYLLQIRDSLGCNWDTVVQIIEPPPLEVLNLRDTVVYMGECVELNPLASHGQIATAIWEPDQFISSPPSINVIAAPTVDMTYGVTITNDVGCSASSLVEIDVLPANQLYLPTAFSPNGDGYNEYFHPFAGRVFKSVVKVIRLIIFDPDEHGLIFENKDFLPDDPAEAWDGTYKGVPMKAGTYLYLMEWKRVDKKIILQRGQINLIR